MIAEADGKFKSDRPWFLMFGNGKSHESVMMRDPMMQLAHDFDGAVQFAVIDIGYEEISLAYDAYYVPRGFFINTDGKTYIYDPVLVSVNGTKNWIEEQEYKKSPSKFMVPAPLPQYKVYWAYVKRTVRKWYAANLQDDIEFYLRKYKITYLVDMDPTDFANIDRLTQKTDR